MKVLFLAKYLPQTGSTTHMYSLVKNLIQNGHDVHMISSGPTEDTGSVKIFNDIVDKGLIHHRAGFPCYPDYTVFGRVTQLLRYIWVCPKVLFLMFKIKPDVVHVHYPVTSYLAKLYQLFTGTKFITTYHISGIPKHPLHKKGDYAIAISRELKTELMARFHYRENQISLIFNGVSSQLFTDQFDSEEKLVIKHELHLPVSKPVIGFVGSFNQRKGVDVLLSACSKLRHDFHLVLLGDGDRQWVNGLIDKNNLNHKVSLFSFQNPAKFYAIYDVFVLPSRREGFPLVTLEAMMAGLPVIRSNTEGSADQIENGFNGYIFKNEDANQLASQLETLLENEELRKKMGNYAKDFVLSKFTEEIMMEKLVSLYEKAIHKTS